MKDAAAESKKGKKGAKGVKKPATRKGNKGQGGNIKTIGDYVSSSSEDESGAQGKGEQSGLDRGGGGAERDKEALDADDEERRKGNSNGSLQAGQLWLDYGSPHNSSPLLSPHHQFSIYDNLLLSSFIHLAASSSARSTAAIICTNNHNNSTGWEEDVGGDNAGMMDEGKEAEANAVSSTKPSKSKSKSKSKTAANKSASAKTGKQPAPKAPPRDFDQNNNGPLRKDARSMDPAVSWPAIAAFLTHRHRLFDPVWPRRTISQPNM